MITAESNGVMAKYIPRLTLTTWVNAKYQG